MEREPTTTTVSIGPQDRGMNAELTPSPDDEGEPETIPPAPDVAAHVAAFEATLEDARRQLEQLRAQRRQIERDVAHNRAVLAEARADVEQLRVRLREAEERREEDAAVLPERAVDGLDLLTSMAVVMILLLVQKLAHMK